MNSKVIIMARGGTRKGAGRPKGLEPTKAIRVPINLLPSIERLVTKTYKLPLYGSKVAAGFPSPAEDYIADNLDLNEYLIKHPAATFLVKATGDSMINAGIHDNDILVVDRSLKPSPGKIIIIAIDGQLTVKRLHKSDQGSFVLMPDNPAYKPIEVREGSDTYIWGVVTQVIHSV
jgi:DNA polymerase V